MSPPIAPVPAHPQGEPISTIPPEARNLALPSLAVDTVGRRFHVEWDPLAPVTPLGQLVFFVQFLAASGLYAKWVAGCPLRYQSPNAPAVADVLGTTALAILSGACRYAHVTALRGDKVNPKGLGMEKVVSEDSLRRAFQDAEAPAVAAWQTDVLLSTYAPALDQPWIADLDVTIKPVYGHQEGAELGYNPRKPGRPSHAYHTVFMRTLRVALDVEVRPGKEHPPRTDWRTCGGFWTGSRPSSGLGWSAGTPRMATSAEGKSSRNPRRELVPPPLDRRSVATTAEFRVNHFGRNPPKIPTPYQMFGLIGFKFGSSLKRLFKVCHWASFGIISSHSQSRTMVFVTPVFKATSARFRPFSTRLNWR